MTRKRDGLDAYRRLRKAGLDDLQSEAVVDLPGIERGEALTVSELDDVLSSFERRFTMRMSGMMVGITAVFMLISLL